ncbi:MAG: hypothetical protein LBT18_04925 [Endomicrobium sp.]|jgi:flagellar biosynthesis/type III secretory pathway M-ring protein FliF/YscJ|nr:hypothetical protein [Endomicrobium sp.]
MKFKSSKKDNIRKIETQFKQINEQTVYKTEKDGNDILWKPTYKWYVKSIGIVLGILIITFFVLNIVLKPYMRNINHEITPWLGQR